MLSEGFRSARSSPHNISNKVTGEVRASVATHRCGERGVVLVPTTDAWQIVAVVSPREVGKLPADRQSAPKRVERQTLAPIRPAELCQVPVPCARLSMLFAPIAFEAMKCKEENCEVGVVLEHNSLIVLSVNKTIICLCGKNKHNPFERG